MRVLKLAENIYSVGVINPSLRVFDIIMTAEYGTSYNAYLVKGDHKTALIDTVHEGFFEEYIANVSQLCDITKIDYLVVNHAEPDHSGSIRRLLDLNPNISVISTAPAKKYVTEITNAVFTSQVVKAGETIDLGGKVLEFTPAPFLHWPDSMFTLEQNSRIAFTCDFLGVHYCEPQMLDKYIYYPEKHAKAFRYYYDCIFSPFKPYVLQGLDKLTALDPKMVCPSHGPILVETLKDSMNNYRKWSEPAEKTGKKVLIAHASAYGYTVQLAEAVEQALSSKGYTVDLVDLVTEPLSKTAPLANECDILFVGSDTINKDATKPVWDLLSSIDAINTGKPAGAFGSYGWSGEAVPMVKSRLEQLKFKFAGDGLKVQFRPTDDDLEKVKAYALEVVGE